MSFKMTMMIIEPSSCITFYMTLIKLELVDSTLKSYIYISIKTILLRKRVVIAAYALAFVSIIVF